MKPSSTSNSSPWRFMARMGWWVFPILLVTGFLEWMWWRSGETWPVVRAAAAVEGKSSGYLYGRGLFSQVFQQFKYEMIKLRSPKILVLGSSRVMQMRDFNFHPLESVFYNAGGCIRSIPDIEAIASKIRSGQIKKPDVIILGLDPWWFKDSYRITRSPISDDSFSDDVLLPGAHVMAFRRMIRKWNDYRGLFSAAAYDPSPGFGQPALGAEPLCFGSGFRYDGSYQYSPDILIRYVEKPGFIDREIPAVIQRIKSRQNHFSPPYRWDQAKEGILLSALNEWVSMNIHVMVFQPPFSNESLSAIEADREMRAWWNRYRQELPTLIRSSGCYCLVALSPGQYGLTDDVMYDGMHAGEVLVSHIVYEMIRDNAYGDGLRAVDLDALLARLNAPVKTPLAFDFPGGRK